MGNITVKSLALELICKAASYNTLRSGWLASIPNLLRTVRHRQRGQHGQGNRRGAHGFNRCASRVAWASGGVDEGALRVSPAM
eukprot:5111331-Pleurochrysis_carterae.AAC.1